MLNKLRFNYPVVHCVALLGFVSFSTEAINCGKSVINMGSLQADYVLLKMKNKYNCLAMVTTLNFLSFSCSLLTLKTDFSHSILILWLGGAWVVVIELSMHTN